MQEQEAFVPGTRVVFADDFKGEAEGKTPAHWKIVGGHAEIGSAGGRSGLALVESRSARVAPALAPPYLPDAFTLEFDLYASTGSFGGVILYLTSGDDERQIAIGAEVLTNGMEHELGGRYPGSPAAYLDKWHHVAVSVENNQLKCWEDAHRILVAPDLAGFKPRTLSFGAIANPDAPVIIRAVRIAAR